MMPTNSEEYLARFHENYKLEGYGLDLTIHTPCPFCSAAGFLVYKLLDMERESAKEHTCSECGRSSKLIFQRDANGVQFEVVQTGGDNQPEWLVPKMRRIESQKPAVTPVAGKGLTTDPRDPRLGHGVDDKPVPQNAAYLVLSEEERAKGYVRPVRRSYVHTVCGTVTTMAQAIAETYARDPHYYGSTYCVRCSKHLPVAEFKWDGTDETVGS